MAFPAPTKSIRFHRLHEFDRSHSGNKWNAVSADGIPGNSEGYVIHLTPKFQFLGIGRFKNKVRHGTSRFKTTSPGSVTNCERRFFNQPSVFGHVGVSNASLPGPAVNVRNRVSFRFRRSWPVQKEPRAGHRAVRQSGLRTHLSFVSPGPPSMWTPMPSYCGTSVVPICGSKPLGL